MFSRFAIYYTPETDSALAAFGASWLGWDSLNACPVDHPAISNLDMTAITQTPRKYGFHATIKPPFRLVEGTSVDDLAAALDALCGRAAPVTLDGLEVTRLGRFLALCPVGDTSALGALAGRFVTELDNFRAPASEAELAKRRAARLSPAQDAMLVKWGYPYVLDQFRFHMTLTGRLDRDTAALAETALADQLQDIPLAPFKIGAMTLLGEAADGAFHQIHRYALTG